MCSINSLPREILIHIFKYYLQTETQKDFIRCVAKVCPNWRDVSMVPSLWSIFDGSLSFKALLELSKNGCLLTLTDFKFSTTRNLISREFICKIYSSLPALKCINFSNVQFLDELYFTELIYHCAELCEVVLNRDSSCKKHLKKSLLTEFLKFRGVKLVSIDISNLSINSSLFKSIATFCPNLKELNAENLILSSGIPKFPIQLMQLGCSKLRVLRLGYPIRYSQKSENLCPGFPDLEIFSHVSSTQEIYFDPSNLMRLLFQATKLKVLDIRGCSSITADCICSLPCDLERLYISGTGVLQPKKLYQVLFKWRHSLKALDVSRAIIQDFNYALQHIVSMHGLQQLECLHLNNTNVLSEVLILILRSCFNLQYLQLESCRGVDRVHRHIYSSRSEILNLLAILDKN